MSPPFNVTAARYQAFCHANNDNPTSPTSQSLDQRPRHDQWDTLQSDDTIMTRTNDYGLSDPDSKLRCCCGRPECVYLENNNTLLGGIERDLETAARLGQALLNRHETYVTDSQLEHERLTTYINELEKERTNLQSTNEKIVEENRQLLTRLETVNTSLKDSDSHVKSLEALLKDCEVEVRRLSILTRRTEELELQMMDMEKERMVLSRTVEDSNKERKSTIKRWRESEMKLRQLEIELQKVEWEAKQDRERHEEIIARLERERVLERELGGAEARLKGAAAIQGINTNATGSNVVSHFVRDILQDNANLQAGIAELRELLQTSNEEVQNLREQILQHQPVDLEPSQTDGARSRPLSEQLSWASPKQVQQEVHVHHHYHAKISGKKDRTPTIRRASRKRASIGLNMLPSTPESSAPTTPMAGPSRLVSSPIYPIPLQQPHPRRNRWSVQSAATGISQISSFPSSPRSYYDRSSTIFDRLEAGDDSSRPTSPESAADDTSSRRRESKFDDDFDDDLAEIPESDINQDEIDAKPLSHVSDDDKAEQDRVTDIWSTDLTPKPSQILVDKDEASPGSTTNHPEANPNEDLSIASLEEPEPPDLPLVHDVTSTRDSTDNVDTDLSISLSQPPEEEYNFNDVLDMHNRPGLRRRGSHDSLVSISGMDIHIAKRPSTSTSQASSLLKGNRAYFARSPSAARSFSAAQPLATVTEFTALSTARSLGAADEGGENASNGPPRTPSRTTSMSVEALSGLAGLPVPSQAQPQPATGGFGRMVGGWVRSKWGVTPVKSSGDLRAQARAQDEAPPPLPGDPLSMLFGSRSPGINQPGTIPGFRTTRKPPLSGVEVNMMDEEGLKEILAESDQSHG
ncbi:hypothetical protein B0A52_04121 [Exophiala mesophila]|uniref:Uncharacterized protein n=1 Tax=Exophiala mesophila TaxID=212818 RepID=A0A438NAS0_EXOME|nr:hypothetical protein B0A52_04121 [Exophiala mesophila]